MKIKTAAHYRKPKLQVYRKITVTLNLRQKEKKKVGGALDVDEMKHEYHKYGENTTSGWKMDLNSVCIQNP